VARCPGQPTVVDSEKVLFELVRVNGERQAAVVHIAAAPSAHRRIVEPRASARWTNQRGDSAGGRISMIEQRVRRRNIMLARPAPWTATIRPADENSDTCSGTVSAAASTISS
jgi:hypothetical protein